MTSGTHPGESHRSLKERLREGSRRLVAGLPFVARRRYRRCLAELAAARVALDRQQQPALDELRQLRAVLLTLPHSLAGAARIEWRLPLARARPEGECCLFVTHAAGPELKRHVVDHVRQLHAAGIAVVLIVNTDLAPEKIQLPEALAPALLGCLVRQNLGFDFAAWAHGCALLDMERVQRLFLINDSIVGPLDAAAFTAMLARIRASAADLVGLTQNPYPQWHLQSFFLVVNQRLLRASVFADLMRHIVNLDTKEAVINTYEIQVSGHLRAQGFRCEPLFANLEPGSPLPDDTYFRWAAMVRVGFPFIKASILRQELDSAEVAELVPLQYREAARAAP